MIDVEIHEGGLYTDISISSLGLQPTVGTFGWYIPYPRAVWEAIGQEAVESAQANAPVDTGYLRDHIQYHADDGGVEIVATAPYSAYQEYGTIYMNGRNYFEPAVRNAVEAHMADLYQVESLTASIADILTTGPNMISSNAQFVLVQCNIATGYLNQLAALGCTAAELDDLNGCLDMLRSAAIKAAQYQEEYKQVQSEFGILGQLAIFLAQLLAMMILAFINTLISQISYSAGSPRNHERVFF